MIKDVNGAYYMNDITWSEHLDRLQIFFFDYMCFLVNVWFKVV